MSRTVLYLLTALVGLGAIYFFVIQLVAVGVALLCLIVLIAGAGWFFRGRRG